MDEIASYNKERWEELARGNVTFSRPALDLDPASAREMVERLHGKGLTIAALRIDFPEMFDRHLDANAVFASQFK